jgi:methionyl-tRNA formyltransferase
MIDAKKLRIIFLGTPDFAVASLKALVENGYNVVAVITAPDKQAGRGLQLQQSAVKQFAIDHQLPVLQPPKLKDQDFIDTLKTFAADLQIVVAFRMLPQIVWQMPAHGTINVHGSLLPNYRGAAPINWAIINGEKQTGVTTFLLQQEIDTGNILLQDTLPILDTNTVGEVYNQLMEKGAALLLKTIEKLANGLLVPIDQNLLPAASNHAPKIFTETCQINFNKTVEEVYNLIRGLSPYPAAFCFLNNKKLKVYSALKTIINHQNPCGFFETDGKSYIHFYCQDGYIALNDIQLEGKKRMLTADFLRGFRL